MRWVLAWLWPLLVVAARAPGSHRADWLHDCGWGVFTHFLPGNRDRDPVQDAETCNRIVDSFNTSAIGEKS